MKKNELKDNSWKPTEKWHGVNLLGMFRKPDDTSDFRAKGYFDEEYFKWLRDWGFNFARLPMDYQHFIVGDDKFVMNEEGFGKVDKAVEFGQKYGIHIQLCLHHAPGFSILSIPGETRDLQENPESQRAFCGLWQTFAKRYAGIPNESLSFNPLNEPNGFTTEQFVKVFGDTIEAIRKADPTRFVMLDGNRVASEPVPQFFNVKSTGQAFRGYTPHALTHYKAIYIKAQPKNEPSWPCLPGPEDDPDLWIWEQPEKTLKKYDWVIETGYPVMVGEFGCGKGTRHDVCLKWMEHCLLLWTEKGLSWAIWNMDGPFGFMDSARADVDYEDFHGRKLDRKMLNLLQRFLV